ncbi:hypothetical protein [Flavobacterium adhaerens]|uniref:hypothetical protein n=1 Tax=Flavobacterium adhaerens TaxID=3149043 RepID=UPI0032B413F2
MIFLKNAIIILNLLFFITPTSAQSIHTIAKVNPLLELEINTKTLGLKGQIAEMQEHQFVINEQGHTINDSASISNLYRFDQNGLTKEIEETLRNLESKKKFFSYTNKGLISHIDIETTRFSNNIDAHDSITSTAIEPDFSTLDYKYVQKKNILFKGEDYAVNLPKKITTRKEYFYHFNDKNQIFQIVNQDIDSATQYSYDANGLVTETRILKSGILSHKNIYRYDNSKKLVRITTIKADNNTKLPNEETLFIYKLDTNGNIVEKKAKTYVYSPKGTKRFTEGYLYLYNYIYL